MDWEGANPIVIDWEGANPIAIDWEGANPIGIFNRIADWEGPNRVPIGLDSCHPWLDCTLCRFLACLWFRGAVRRLRGLLLGAGSSWPSCSRPEPRTRTPDIPCLVRALRMWDCCLALPPFRNVFLLLDFFWTTVCGRAHSHEGGSGAIWVFPARTIQNVNQDLEDAEES